MSHKHWVAYLMKFVEQINAPKIQTKGRDVILQAVICYSKKEPVSSIKDTLPPLRIKCHQRKPSQ